MVSFALGDPGDLVDRVHEIGARFMQQVGTVEQAERAAEGGADILVAQGAEAGGFVTRRGVGTMALVPQVVDAVHPVPVVAAGGMADGRGLAAALVLGAAGVNLGTRFLACAEAEGDLPVQRLREQIQTALGVGDVHELTPLTGQSAGLVREVLPAAELVRRLVTEAVEALEHADPHHRMTSRSGEDREGR